MSNTRYFINIIDIANLANMQSTLCLYQIIICSVPPTSSTLQCRSTSNRHSVCIIHMYLVYSVYVVDIVNIAMWTKVESILSVIFLVYLVVILNIAMLINIVSTSYLFIIHIVHILMRRGTESTLCLHCTSYILFLYDAESIQRFVHQKQLLAGALNSAFDKLTIVTFIFMPTRYIPLNLK